jgi:hypothetical protein
MLLKFVFDVRDFWGVSYVTQSKINRSAVDGHYLEMKLRIIISVTKLFENYQHFNFETISPVLDDTLLHFFSPSVDRFY